jgi:hypothetical protein
MGLVDHLQNGHLLAVFVGQQPTMARFGTASACGNVY